MASSGGPAISRPRGQELARRELARSIYRPSWLARIWHDITHWLGSLLSTGGTGAPSWWGLALLALAVAAIIAVVVYWLGPTRRNHRAADRAVADAAPRSARDYRDAAEELAANGNFGAAIIERIRAIVVDLETRDVLLRRPARTAMELAAEAGAAFPAEATALSAAARGFDDVRYGGRAGTERAYQRIRDLDIRLAAAVAATPAEPDLVQAPASHAVVPPASAPVA
jgi:hypothetical protein